MARFLKDRYFWYIVALVVLLGILTGIETYFLYRLPAGEEWHLTYISLQHIPFLVAVAIAAWRFGVRWGLAISFIAGLIILLPHTISETVGYWKPDMLPELGILISLGIIFSWLIGTRKKAGEQLRESEEKYRTIFTQARDGIVLIDSETGQIVDCNPEFESQTGRQLEQLKKMTIWQVRPTEKIESAKKKFLEIKEKGIGGSSELEFQKPDGEIVPVEFVSKRIKIQGRDYNQGITRDITERKKAEEWIRRAAEEWRTTFDSITELVSIHDTDFKLVRVNKAFANTCKMKPAELVGKTCYEVVHGTHEPAPNCPHKKTMAIRKAATEEFFEPHLGIHLEVSTSPICNEKGEVTACVHVARDITKRKLMEEQLIITDRLASIGELASGIAHELNNPLTSIIGFSQLLLDKDIPDDIKEDMGIIHREAQRTAEVVKNLLTFARKHTPVKQLVNIDSIIEKVLGLRAYEQRVSNIQVNTRFDPNLPEIVADHFQLQQVFLNIIINAEHFMIEAHGRGTLTITTKRTGDIITASFTDDGPGIPKEDLGHLFDPFFTTKEVGKGTGLGLSICHGVISEHGGRIYVESKLGKGATFVVELPIGNH